MKKFWDAVHNAVAHPLLVILPEKLGNQFHDWTAKKAYG
jgi:hypothetical protein